MVQKKQGAYGGVCGRGGGERKKGGTMDGGDMWEVIRKRRG